jgi:hypothetical protein
MHVLAHAVGFAGALLFLAGPVAAFWLRWTTPVTSVVVSTIGVVLIAGAAALLRSANGRSLRARHGVADE